MYNNMDDEVKPMPYDGEDREIDVDPIDPPPLRERKKIMVKLINKGQSQPLPDGEGVYREPTHDDIKEDCPECEELRKAFAYHNHEIEDMLGGYLYGYANGLPLWGDHVAITLASEAIRKLEQLKEENIKLQTKNDSLEKLLRNVEDYAEQEDELKRRLKIYGPF